MYQHHTRYHIVSLTDKAREHPTRVLNVARFPKNLCAEGDNSIRTDNDAIGKATGDRYRFLKCVEECQLRRSKITAMQLVNRCRDHFEFKSGRLQEIDSSRRR